MLYNLTKTGNHCQLQQAGVRILTLVLRQTSLILAHSFTASSSFLQASLASVSSPLKMLMCFLPWMSVWPLQRIAITNKVRQKSRNSFLCHPDHKCQPLVFSRSCCPGRLWLPSLQEVLAEGNLSSLGTHNAGCWREGLRLRAHLGPGTERQSCHLTPDMTSPSSGAHLRQMKY